MKLASRVDVHNQPQGVIIHNQIHMFIGKANYVKKSVCVGVGPCGGLQKLSTMDDNVWWTVNTAFARELVEQQDPCDSCKFITQLLRYRSKTNVRETTNL